MRYHLTSLFIFFVLSLPGQSYQLTRSNETRYYQLENSEVALSLHVVEAGLSEGDSLFIFEPQMINLEDINDFPCFEPLAAWLGKSVRISPNGDTYITSALDETIFLKSQADLGESWVAWTANDASMFLQAEVISVAEELVIDELEVVRTIQLQMQFEGGLAVETDFEEVIVKLGAESGLVESPLWGAFPLRSDATTFDGLGKARLVGIEGFAGWQDFNWMEVMDFEPNDQIHIDEGYNLGGSLSSWTKSAITFFNRTDYPDSIVYEIERDWWSFSAITEPGAEPITDSGVAFEIITVTEDSLFDTRPYAPLFLSASTAGYLVMGIDEEGRHYKSHGIGASVDPCLSSSSFFDLECYIPTLHVSCTPAKSYLRLGGPYYDISFESGPGGTWRKLVYYNKGGEEWGEPLGIFDFIYKSVKPISFFPNPTYNHFTVELEGEAYPAQVIIHDAQGRFLHQQVVFLDNSLVILPQLSAQTLFVKLVTRTGEQMSGRLVLLE